MSQAKASKHDPSEPSTPDTTAASSPPSLTVWADRIALNRDCPILAPASIPRRPAAYVPPPVEDNKPKKARAKKPRLRTIADALKDKAVAAANQAIARGANLQADLGSHAMTPAALQAVLDRVTNSAASVALTTMLIGYLTDVGQIANNDLALALDDLKSNYDFVIKNNPAVAEHYTALVAFFTAKREAIIEGRKEAKAKKDAKAAAAKAATPTQDTTPAQK